MALPVRGPLTRDMPCASGLEPSGVDVNSAPPAQCVQERLRRQLSREVVDLTGSGQPSREPEPQAELESQSKLQPAPAVKKSSLPVNWSKLTRVELRTLLCCFGLDTDGSKADLVRRLSLHTDSATGGMKDETFQPERNVISTLQTKVEKRLAREAREAREAAARAGRPQIVCWDIETTIPRFGGEGYQYATQAPNYLALNSSVVCQLAYHVVWIAGYLNLVGWLLMPTRSSRTQDYHIPH